MLEWVKHLVGMEPMEVQAMYDEDMIDEDFVQYNAYDIIFTVLYAGSLNQIKLEVYFTPEEAFNAFKLLNKKIEELVRLNTSVALSLVCRNKEGEIIRHGISGIVGIQHNIPQFSEVLDE